MEKGEVLFFDGTLRPQSSSAVAVKGRDVET